MQRSPPTPACASRDLQSSHTQSDSNLPALVLDEDLHKNISKRIKRVCRSPPEIERDSNNDIGDLKNLLLSFQKEQSTILKTLISDVNEIKISKDNQSSILNQIITDINEVKQQNIQIQKANLELDNKIEVVHSNFEIMKQQIDNLQKENKEYSYKVFELESKILDMERSSRHSAIEIKNLPQKSGETPDDLKSTILKLGELLSIPISLADIRDAYRLPGKPGKTRPIVSEFTSVSMKTDILAATKVFNKNRQPLDKINSKHLGLQEQPTPVYVTEYLPGSSRKLFYLAREFIKEYNFKYCWTSHGRILIQKDDESKAIHVKNEQVLNDIRRQLL